MTLHCQQSPDGWIRYLPGTLLAVGTFLSKMILTLADLAGTGSTGLLAGLCAISSTMTFCIADDTSDDD